MKKIARSELNALFAAISAQKQLYIPADTKAGQAQFTLWQDGIVLTDKSPD